MPQTAVTVSAVTLWPSRSQQSAACASQQLRHLFLSLFRAGAARTPHPPHAPSCPLARESCPRVHRGRRGAPTSQPGL